MSTKKRFNPPRSLRAAITRAIKLLEPEYGWVKLCWIRYVPNVPGNPIACAYCLDGAIAMACNGYPNSDKGELLTKARKLVAKVIRSSGYAYPQRAGNAAVTITDFNDFSERVKGEVLDILNTAKELA